jgi:hypothetical protein
VHTPSVMLHDIFDQARPEVYGLRFAKVLRLYYKIYNSTPSLPDKVLLELAMWDHFATEIAQRSPEYLISCVDCVLHDHVGMQLANTDLVESVSRH